MEHPAWHMKRALRLAKKGLGYVLPNPMVGAVLVKDGRRIGEGYHTSYGSAHAELNALNDCQESPKGATLFVSLEPCCHQGKTPPCTEAILAAGIKKVYTAVLDPSEKVHGKGIELLKSAGIDVEVGLLEDEARALNRDFFTFHIKKRPFVNLKVAVSLDGRITERSGETTQLTGKSAQKQVHLMRHSHQAVLLGAGTILTDDPHLGVRLVEGRDPLRVLLKGDRALSSDLQVFRDDNYIIFEKESIPEILKKLYERGVISVLVEGGEEVFTAFLKEKVVDELNVFITPHLFGRFGVPLNNLDFPIEFSNSSVQEWGHDVLMTATPKWDSNKP